MVENTSNAEDVVVKKKEFYVPRENYAKSRVFPLWATKSAPIASSYKNEEIARLLKNPAVNYKKLQEISNYLFGISSVYKNIVYYLATIMTFDWIVFPTNLTKDTTTMQNRLESAAKKVHMADPASVFPTIVARAIVNGEAYFYDLSDSDNTIYKEIPSKFCQLAMVDDDNLWRYFIDLSLLKPDDLYEMPSEIQKAHEKWVKGGKKKKKEIKLLDGVEVELPSHYFLVSKRGFCIHVHMSNSQHDYPFLVGMFQDLNRAEENKAYYDEILKDNYVKVIHMKIPTDSETGEPLLEKDLIQQFHDSSKNHVPQNISFLTNPFEIEAVNLDSSQKVATNIVENDYKVTMQDSGISETMFSASTVNSLSYSIQSDAAKMYPLLKFFNNLMTYRLKQEKFACKFMEISMYNKDEKHKLNTTDLASGGSRLKWASTSDIDIYETIQLSKLENMLDIDSLFPIKMNANQMSGDAENPPNRPPKDDADKADSTVVGDNYR